MTRSFSLRMNKLKKTYGDRTVLDVDGLELHGGCSYALVGPNGSGKSTLLKVLSGVVDQTSGGIDVVAGQVAKRGALRDDEREAGGEAAAGATREAGVGAAREAAADRKASPDSELPLPPAREDLAVGYMPQKSYVFGFSVHKNVELALKSASLPRDEVQRRVADALAAVGMDAFADVRGSGLSGGEAQRVALARMLVQDLDVLLLDEPTASMDIAGTLLVEDALEHYRERTGCLVVVATHAPSQARRVAEQTVMLESGRVVENGPTERVLTHPESEAGRSFLSYWAV